MVKSLLIPDIEYPEIRTLLPEDKNHDVSTYDITLFDEEEVIALGQPVNTFIERNIVYYPIYLVKNDKVTKQIGLYETFGDNVVNILDEDGDIDLLKMGEPILYDATEKKELQSDDEDEDDDVILVEEELSVLPEQTKLDAEKERSTYIEDNTKHWLQSYFKNNNYKMIENEGKGDCLYAVIRDAFAKVGVYKSVDEMRNILAANVTEDVFRGYKTVFQDAFDTDIRLQKEITVLVTRHNGLKKKIDELKDRNAKQIVIIQADEIKERYELLKRERAYTKSVVEGEMKMMKKIHNLTQFKALIKTCAFWGDTWAISTLERVLNIKLILFSEENYKAGDLDNVLTCGQLNDEVLEKKGIFEPDYYILTIYQGYHYQLISYKDRGALTFKELPYDVKVKVVDKCLERLAGPYYIIPDFRNFMETNKGEAADALANAIANASLGPTPIGSASLANASLGPANEPLGPVSLEEMQSDLYNNITVFQFYINSLDKPPGKGVGDTMPQDQIGDFKELVHIKDWRRKLDNLWLSPFTLDGHKWNTVEHYLQGSKFKRRNPEFYLQFSLDSGSALSKDTDMAIAAGGKSGKLAKEQIRPKEVKIDLNFSGDKEMEAAQYAKFSQNKDLKEILLATKKAKLQHFSRGSPPVLFTELMRVRQRLL
jgi:predicted NAD-dependent protein-ADP-ribosyltransferase YbiA (DUF1768 family)